MSSLASTSCLYLRKVGAVVRYYFIALLAVIMTAGSQILLKMAARHAKHETWRLYLNGYTIISYISLVVVTLLNLYAYKYIPLKAAVVLLPLTLIMVVLFSVLILHEKLTHQQMVGSVVIMVGLVIFNL